MRIGNNPNRSAAAPAYLRPVALHVNVYLPNLEGYHAQRMEVVKTCLTTMVQGARMPHTLIITASDTMPEMLRWIEEVLQPDIFINCKNFGKTASRKMIAQMLPPETILGYSDDDMLFSNNWLAPQIELLKGFPNVACVSGYPVRTSFRWGNDNTKAWARAEARLTAGRFIPNEWERDFCVSIGRDYAEHIKTSADDVEYLIDYKGMQAYATSHHCQQIGYAGVINKVLKYNGLAMGSERQFDEDLDKLGLRLATTKRLARHIGNIMDDSILAAKAAEA